MNNTDFESVSSIHEFTARNIKGAKVKLTLYKGHVDSAQRIVSQAIAGLVGQTLCIIVNVASHCKLAAINYKQLNDLYEQYAERKGLRILAFPCNQFNGLEPGDSEQIASFAADHHIKFDMFEKIDVNGENAHPLWKFLKKRHGGVRGNFIKFNFEKFIINKDGVPMERLASGVYPVDLLKSLEKYW